MPSAKQAGCWFCTIRQSRKGSPNIAAVATGPAGNGSSQCSWNVSTSKTVMPPIRPAHVHRSAWAGMPLSIPKKQASTIISGIHIAPERSAVQPAR